MMVKSQNWNTYLQSTSVDFFYYLGPLEGSQLRRFGCCLFVGENIGQLFNGRQHRKDVILDYQSVN